jgi:hypothetical protein
VGRTPLPKDEALQPLNVKVPSEDLYFVQEVLRPALGASYNAEAVREVLVQLRTCFRLPQYVVDVLEGEMKAKKLNILGYVQELLLRRYEAIRDKTAREARAPAGAAGEHASQRESPGGSEVPGGSAKRGMGALDRA